MLRTSELSLHIRNEQEIDGGVGGGTLKRLVRGLRSSQGRELHCRPSAVEAETRSQAQALKC